jgi:hypothetical protein
VTPFHWTRERLHSGVASLLVALRSAASKVARAGFGGQRVAAIPYCVVRTKIIANKQTPLLTN